MRYLYCLLAVMLFAQLGFSQTVKPELLVKSQRIARLITQDSGYVVEKMAGKVLKDAMESSGATLGGAYMQMTGNFGTIVSIGDTRFMGGSYYAPLKYAKDSIFLQLHYDEAGLLDGLYFRPKVKLPPTWKTPDYMMAGTENEVLNFKSDGLDFSGHLTLPPVGKREKVIALLLTGSGPNDFKGTVGPNQYLSDLAYGLAAQGISSMRYDKRTVAHAATLKANEVGPEEEVINDAVSALLMLKNSATFSDYKIVLVGHSLSAMLGPEIAKRAKFIAGAALLGTPARRFEEIITQQMFYLMSAQAGADTTELKKQGDDFVKLIQSGRYKGLDGAQLFGLSPIYWTWLNKYDVVKAGKAVKTPFLVVQGERDYQVNMQDYALLKTGWASRKNTTFKLYPNTNHLLMEGQGKPMPKEYDTPNHVYFPIIQDLGNWMKGL